jgi:hypothetical protein
MYVPVRDSLFHLFILLPRPGTPWSQPGQFPIFAQLEITQILLQLGQKEQKALLLPIYRKNCTPPKFTILVTMPRHCFRTTVYTAITMPPTNLPEISSDIYHSILGSY